MASDESLRQGVRQNLKTWIKKLECNGDVVKQQEFKQKFIEKLKSFNQIAIETEKANEQHYEVPTEFFTTVLGPHMKYSSCVWPEAVSTLAEAEDAALKRICTLAKLEDGHAVMDLGCGWGALGLYIAKQYPHCRVTFVSNSNTQRQYIERCASESNLSARVQCITADANSFNTDVKFDRIITIEMLEHMKNYSALFQRISRWLKPAGLLFSQILCHRSFPYNFDTKRGADTEWMARNFFSGGTMPSSDLFLYFQDDLVLQDMWLVNGTNYARTLEAWLQQLDSKVNDVIRVLKREYGEDGWEQQLFNWRLFFMFCAEVFGYKGGNEWLVAQHLFKKRVLSAL